MCGFPLGAVSSEQKAVEARLSVEAGADEVERVIHIGPALVNEWDAVEADVRAVRRAIPDSVRKMPTLMCFLTDEQKREAAVVRAGAEFVKSGAGFGLGGAGAGSRCYSSWLMMWRISPGGTASRSRMTSG